MSYEKFVAMTLELGEDPSEQDSIISILTTFYKGDKRKWHECINEFKLLLDQEYTKPLNIDLDFEKDPAERFIIADTYAAKDDMLSLYNHLSGQNKKDISVAMAKKIRNEFLSSVSHFKDTYPWIYDPPSIGKLNEWSIGKQLKQDFQTDYGAYAEMTYLLSAGNALMFDKVNKMPLNEYLALGEYLLRKRAVEGVE